MRASFLVAFVLVACGSSEGALHGGDYADGGGANDAGVASDDSGVEFDGGAGDDAGDGTFPFRLGAAYSSNGRAIVFRVRSEAATTIELSIFANAFGEDAKVRVPMFLETPEGDVWTAMVRVADLRAAGVSGAVFYGFRAWGPNWKPDPSWAPGSAAGFVSEVDASGNRFDPNKLLFDPYGRELSHDPFSTMPIDGSAYATGASNAKDSARIAPKSVALIDDASPVGAKPSAPLKDDVVYEAHVRGLTMNDPSVQEDARGTYRGAAAKAPYLRDLGVTAIELLPIHETQNDTNDQAAANQTTNGMNYWGYSTLAFFAPDRRYSSDKSPGGPTREFKAMVKAFHDAGIKVFLDVVYNHTGEGGASKTTARLLSLRGLDNASYYELSSDDATPYDNTGTGGNVNTAAPITRDLIVDSLSYWASDMGVDGFRFDLAPVLGNSCANGCFQYDAKDPANVLNRALATLPGTPLIAEPWAIGSGTYQLGAFPTGWSEWNGSFRDTIRQTQNKLGVDAITPSQVIARLSGSPDLFGAAGRTPSASIDYVDCHDGFTLRDVYSYDTKSNAQPWPFGPSSGGDDNNDSWDQNGVIAAQAQATRTGLALALISAGVPMIAGGDEMYRTQYGNNNAYNLDSEKNWLDWSLLTSESAFVAFARGALHFRAAHEALRPAAFWSQRDHDGNGLKDLAVVDASGAEASAAYLGDSTKHFVALRLDGAEGGDSAASLYLAYNAGTTDVSATLPAAKVGWRLAGDSAAGTWSDVGAETSVAGATYAVKARSVVVLVDE